MKINNRNEERELYRLLTEQNKKTLVTGPEKLQEIIEKILEVSLPSKITQNLVVSFSRENRQVYFIKQIEYPVKIAIVELFYDQLGFAIPKSQFFSSVSEVAGKIAKIFRKKMIDPEDKKRWKTAQHKRWVEGSEVRPYLMITSKMEGRPFSLLEPSDIIETLEDKELCRQLGKMVFADDMMGNGDRLNDDKCNFGNFFLKMNRETGERSLGLIDQELDVSDATSDHWLERLSHHMAGGFALVVEELLKRTLIQISPTPQTPQREERELVEGLRPNIERWLKEGYNEAVKQFLGDFSSKGKFLKIFSSIEKGDFFKNALKKRYKQIRQDYKKSPKKVGKKLKEKEVVK